MASACHCCHAGSCRQQMNDWDLMANKIKAELIKDFFLCPVFTSKSVSNLPSDLSCFCNPSLHSVALIDTAFIIFPDGFLNLPTPLRIHFSFISFIFLIFYFALTVIHVTNNTVMMQTKDQISNQYSWHISCQQAAISLSRSRPSNRPIRLDGIYKTLTEHLFLVE